MCDKFFHYGSRGWTEREHGNEKKRLQSTKRNTGKGAGGLVEADGHAEHSE